MINRLIRFGTPDRINLKPSSAYDELIYIAANLARLFTFQFCDSLQIRFTRLDVFVRQAPPAVVASRAGEC